MIDWRQLQRLADRLRPAARRRFMEAVQAARSRVDLRRLEAALADGRQGDVERILSTALREDDLAAMAVVLHYAYDRSGEVSAAQATAEFDALLTFDNADALALAWARENSGALIRDITSDQLAGIRAMLAETVDPATSTSVYDLARMLRGTVGLTERQRLAVVNYRASRLAAGMSQDRVRSSTAKYAEAKLRERAETIARTETIAAVNEGQAASWRQGERLGFFSRMERVWIVTPDDRLCPLCQKMKGQRAPITGFFLTPSMVPVATPPAHPRCRCAQGLVPVRTSAQRWAA